MKRQIPNSKTTHTKIHTFGEQLVEKEKGIWKVGVRNADVAEFIIRESREGNLKEPWRGLIGSGGK